MARMSEDKGKDKGEDEEDDEVVFITPHFLSERPDDPNDDVSIMKKVGRRIDHLRHIQDDWIGDELAELMALQELEDLKNASSDESVVY